MRRALLATALALVPSLALAHPGLPGHTHGFADGVLHPLTGLDHVLAMVAVGFHLWHGVASSFQSLGLSSRRFTPFVRKAGKTFAVLIAGG